MLVLVSACQEDDDIQEEELPVFGTCEAVVPNGNLSLSGDNPGKK